MSVRYDFHIYDYKIRLFPSTNSQDATALQSYYILLLIMIIIIQSL